MSLRYRIRWSKQGRTRFVSARDLTSIWERALRRVDLPIAYSEGFTPHAKVSFPDALPVGHESTGEYAELTFVAPIVPDRDFARLSSTLPDGMDVLTYQEVPSGAPKLARLLQATVWELTWPPVDAAELSPLLERRIAELLARDHVEVLRRRPNGDRIVDVRPAVLAATASTRRPPDGGACTVLRAVLRNDGPTVRPNDLHAALSRGDVASPRIIRRVAQGEPTPDGLREALGGSIERMTHVDAEAA
jgi:radical SAM-linked protein